MAKFMLLLYRETAPSILSPEEMQKATEKYMAWARKPFTVDAARLTSDAGRVLEANGGQPTVKDGPYSETKEVLAGYYTIEAANYDEAVRLSLDHPHIEYGGTVEVRQVFGS
jgi:hypothetical protein